MLTKIFLDLASYIVKECPCFKLCSNKLSKIQEMESLVMEISLNSRFGNVNSEFLASMKPKTVPRKLTIQLKAE